MTEIRSPNPFGDFVLCIAHSMGCFLYGYNALKISIIFREKSCKFFDISQKHAAQAAGLGRIGRHTLLITPEFGSMVWLGAVLTELELEPDAMKEDICNNCNLCVNICPVNALEKKR